MNELEMVPVVATMDSREIADLTGKQHAHVCRDIQVMMESLQIDQSKFGSVYKAGNGEERRCYKLPYRETMILISGYSVELRAKIVDRWMELEREVAPRVPQSLSEALRLAADLEDKRQALEAKVRADAPKVELAEAVGVCEKTISITNAAKHFKLHPRAEVFPYLRAMGYLTIKDLPTQAALDAGYLGLKVTKGYDGEIHEQAVVEIWMLENWRAHVVHQIKRWLHAEAGQASA